MNRNILLVVNGVFALCGTASAVNFFDGDFDGGTYSTVVAATPNGSGTVTNFVSGGNPDKFVRLTDSFGTTGLTQVQVALVQLNSAWVYDPSVTGAVSSIDIGGDIRNDSILQSNLQVYLQQGSKLYFGFTDFVNLTVGGPWTPVAKSGLIDISFFEMNSDGSFNFLSNPDFSSSGSSMEFGFGYATNTLGPITTPIETSQEFDNVSITVNPVPEPSTMFLAAVGIGAWIKRRRA